MIRKSLWKRCRILFPAAVLAITPAAVLANEGMSKADTAAEQMSERESGDKTNDSGKQEPTGPSTTPDTPNPTDPPTTPDTPGPTDPPTTPDTPGPTDPPTTPDTPGPTDPPTTPDTPGPTDPPTTPDTPGPTDPPTTPDTPGPTDPPTTPDTPGVTEKPETETPAESESNGNTSENTGQQTTESESETSSEVVTQPETETGSETETETGSETESETEKETKKEKETEKETETETETEEKGEPIEGLAVDPNNYPALNVTENTKEIYRYLTQNMGLNHAAACGVLANIQCESNFNPLAIGDGGTSYGICQWHLGRLTNLMNFCAANGLDFHTLEGQLAYMEQELYSYYGVLSYIQNVPNTSQGAYDAAYYWCMYYESPSDTVNRSMQRGNLAMNEYFPYEFQMEEEKEEEKEEEIRQVPVRNVFWSEYSEDVSGMELFASPFALYAPQEAEEEQIPLKTDIREIDSRVIDVTEVYPFFPVGSK